MFYWLSVCLVGRGVASIDGSISKDAYSLILGNRNCSAQHLVTGIFENMRVCSWTSHSHPHKALREPEAPDW